MSDFLEKLELIKSAVLAEFPAVTSSIDRNELTLDVAAQDYLLLCRYLKDYSAVAMDVLIDLCGVDYSMYADQLCEDDKRFAVVVHLLSIVNNCRVRVRVFALSSVIPCIQSVVSIWSAANWYEREAFDLFGIVFDGHPDLRRILTDYGFIGHPFRKDFPVSGHVEMRYDPDQRRVVYQPVTIVPRENVPRIIREDHYGEVR